jgi:hypothetical protein
MSRYENASWVDLARDAYNVQNACNLSGVIHSFAHVIVRVRTLLESEGKGGTDAVNQHPVCVMYADKIGHLTGHQAVGGPAIEAAYDWYRAQVQAASRYEVVVIAPDGGAMLVFGKYATYEEAHDRATDLTFSYPSIEVIESEQK